MSHSTLAQGAAQRGTSLIEVLVTMVILAFGLLGLAAFQSKAQLGAIESYQRGQAIILLEDMLARIGGNATNASTYVSATPYGTGDSQPTDCAALPSGMQRDVCEWSASLKGRSEVKATLNVGAMTDARGCITQVQAANAATGVCQPAIYLVSVAWQGLHQTKASGLACGQNLYGADTNRRVIAERVVVGLTSCY